MQSPFVTARSNHKSTKLDPVKNTITGLENRVFVFFPDSEKNTSAWENFIAFLMAHSSHVKMRHLTPIFNMRHLTPIS